MNDLFVDEIAVYERFRETLNNWMRELYAIWRLANFDSLLVENYYNLDILIL